MNSYTCSGSSFSAMAVKPLMSAKSTVTLRRSPSNCLPTLEIF